MKTYVNFELHFKNEAEAKKFKENNYCYFDYFQFESPKGMTFGYIDCSEIDCGVEIEGNIIFISQRYENIFGMNSYYKRNKNSDKDIEISDDTFMQMLKTGKMTEVGFYYSDDDGYIDDEYAFEVKNVDAEFNGIKVSVSENFLVMNVD